MNHWEEAKGSFVTPGGDPWWYCPVCKSKESWHIYGIEHTEQHLDKCPVCNTMLKYPWEK